MAIIENGATSTQAKVEGGTMRTMTVARGDTYAVSAVTGVVGAALAANSSVFAMRLDPSSARLAFIERIRLQYTTIVAYTTPLTAGRRLALFRGSGAATSGGTAITTSVTKNTASAASEFNTAQGGDMRVATTGALTVTGITFEADPIRTMSLVHVGNAGNYAEMLWEFHASECAPVVLQPGQVLAIRNPAAMDAAGTWQLVVNVDWHEAPALA